MQHITIFAVGKLKERFFAEAFGEYQKRLAAYCKFTLVEIDECRLPANPSPAEIAKGLEQEGKAMLLKIPPRAVVMPLCIEGKAISSEQLSHRLDEAGMAGSPVAFLIGGSHGLSPEVKRAAHFSLSMSPMTFPHQLARVMLAEQVYRALSISRGGKYHK